MIQYFIFDYVNLTHGFIYLTGNYFVAAGAVLLFYDYPQKFSWKKLLLLVLQVLSAIVVMELLASVYFAIFGNDTLVPFVCGAAVTALYVAFVSKEKPLIKITRAVAYLAVYSLALSITMSMGNLLGRPYYYLQWVLIAANGITIFSGVAFIRAVSIPPDMTPTPLYVTVVCLTSVVCFVFAVIRAIFRMDPAMLIAVSIILIFVFLVIYIAINGFIKKLYSDIDRQAKILMREADETALRMGKENLENLRALRHEIKNQYAVMNALLTAGEYKKLKIYFSSYTDKIAEVAGVADYGNSILNAIAGVAKGRASSAGAKLECKIIVPKKLEISDTDLTSVIVNLVNNAAEYIESAEELSDKTILLEVYKINDTLLVKVTNSVLEKDEERAKSLVTLKKNPEMHGYGSKIVKSVAEKYDGKADFKVENGLFVASALMFLRTKDDDVKIKNGGKENA